jgi:hypothetical protein
MPTAMTLVLLAVLTATSLATAVLERRLLARIKVVDRDLARLRAELDQARAWQRDQCD